MKDYEKMNDSEKINFLAELSSMYYNSGMTQSDIATHFSTTRFKVSKYLQDALDLGVVEISINFPKERSPELEKSLKENFDLKDVIVINKNSLPYDDTLNSLGKIGATYLESLITEDSIIGVLWGKSLSNLIKNLHPITKFPIMAVQVIGAAAKDNPLTDTHDLLRRLSIAYNGSYKHLYAPLYIENDYARTALMQEPVINDTIFLASKADILLTGIGTTEAVFASSTWTKYLTRELKNKSAVGCIYGRAYDIEGNLVEASINSKVIGVDLKTLMQVRNKVAISSGKFKAESILGALRGKFINVLITDDETATKVLTLMEEK
ncbi:MAG: sugar-binding transcriptional regulator [Sarcina sp.]